MEGKNNKYGVKVLNSIENLISGIGTESAKSSSNIFTENNVKHSDLWGIYSGSWLASNGIDTVISDALSGFRTLGGEAYKLDDEYNIKDVVKKALVYMMVFGGCAVVARSASVDEKMPLNSKALKYEVFPPHYVKPKKSSIEENPLNDNFGNPQLFKITNTKNSNGRIVHSSRIFIFTGSVSMYPIGSFWNESVLSKVYDDILSAMVLLKVIEDTAIENRIDTFRIPNLMSMCASEDETKKLLKRFAINQQLRSIYDAQLIDREEEYLPSTTSLANLKDLLESKLGVIASGFGIPKTKFLGQSAGGQNATGEGDSRDYYQKVETLKTVNIKPFLTWFDKTANTGYENWSFDHSRVISPLEQSVIDKSAIETAVSISTLASPEIALRYLLESSSLQLTSEELAALGLDDE